MSDILCDPELVLKSERLHLRPLEPEACGEAYRGWLEDPEVNQYLETRWRQQSLADIRAFVAAINADPANLLLGIHRAEDGVHIGNIKLGPVNRRHACADISYLLGERSAWGQGFATEAIRRVVAFAFAEVGLHRVQAGLYEDNRASAWALEKVGFIREGTWRRQLKGPDGRWQDHWWFGLLAEEFTP